VRQDFSKRVAISRRRSSFACSLSFFALLGRGSDFVNNCFAFFLLVRARALAFPALLLWRQASYSRETLLYFVF
jgi:hypothetical protein